MRPCTTRVRPASPPAAVKWVTFQSPPPSPPFRFSCSSLPCKQCQISIGLRTLVCITHHDGRLVSPESLPHVYLYTEPHQQPQRARPYLCELTKPRLHSKTACRNDLQVSGSSSVCCLRHSDGSFPFLSTQSDRMRQSFRASSSGSQVADIVRRYPNN